MVQIIYEKGDCFSFPEGFGLALSENSAVVVVVNEPKKYDIRKSSIPTGSVPTDMCKVPFKIRLALLGALAASN